MKQQFGSLWMNCVIAYMSGDGMSIICEKRL